MMQEYVSHLMAFVKESREKKQQHDRSWYLVIALAMGAGFIGMIVLSKNLQMFACALLIGTAATLVGAFAGFVFGIPKTVASAEGSGTAKGAFKSNTNLEEISDWLTKILVGAGLVELNKALDAFKAFGSSFNPAVGDVAAKQHHIGKAIPAPLGDFGWVAAPALVITYSICGFLLAYLWARIYLTQDLERQEAARTLAILGPTDPPPQDPPPQDQPPQDPPPKDPTPQDPPPKDPTPKDPTPKDPTPKDPTPKDPTPKDPTPKDPTPKDPTPKDPTPKDPTPKDPTPKDPTL